MPDIKSLMNIFFQEIDTKESILAALQQVYKTLGVGSQLPFSTIENFWLHDTPLDEQWLDELAKHARLDYQQDNPWEVFDLYKDSDWKPAKIFSYSYYYSTSQTKNLQKILLTNLPVEQWSRLTEKCVYLFCPLLPPRSLHNWFSFSREDANPKPAPEKLCSATIQHLLPIATAIATASEEWRAVHAWLKNGDSDPALLQNELQRYVQGNNVEKEGGYSLDDPARFAQYLNDHLIAITLIRLLLRSEENNSLRWIQFLLASGLMESWKHMHFITELQDKISCYKLMANQVKPAFQQVLQYSKNLDELENRLDDKSLCSSILNPNLFALIGNELELLSEITERGGNIKDCSSMGIVEPKCELFVAKKLFAEGRQFFLSESPDCIAWYRTILPEITKDEQLNDIILLLSRHQSEEETFKLIQTNFQEKTAFNNKIMQTITAAPSLAALLQSSNKDVRAGAALQLYRLAQDEIDSIGNGNNHAKESIYWPMLLAESKNQPELFISNTVNDYWLTTGEAERWEIMYRLTSGSGAIAGSTIRAYTQRFINQQKQTEPAAKEKDITVAETLANRLYAINPLPFHAIYCRWDSSNTLAALAHTGTELQQLIPGIAATALLDSENSTDSSNTVVRDAVCQALVNYPHTLAELEIKSQKALLPVLNDNALVACGAAVVALLETDNKDIHKPVVALIKRSALVALEKSGLLQLNGKQARRILLTGMALNTDPALTPFLRDLLTDTAHSRYSHGLMLDALETRGENLENYDTWHGLTLEKLQLIATKEKIPAAAAKLWHADYENTLATLGSACGKFLLTLMLESTGEAMPRQARQILDLLPVETLPEITLHMTASWIFSNGSQALDPLLFPLPLYGDDRIAYALVKACKDWKKTRKPKASRALKLLCTLPGILGASEALALWNSNQLSDSIQSTARIELGKIAEKQGLTFMELRETLVPNYFFTTEGLRLDIGTGLYIAKISPDMNFQLINPDGKACKSLPKPGKDTDNKKHNDAEIRLKFIKKNLPVLFKRQSERLFHELKAGRQWPTSLWEKSFMDHPILSIFIQNIVWSADDAAGQSHFRFRRNETGKLTDIHGEEVSLSGISSISVAHPVNLSKAEIAAWREYFLKHALNSPVSQWDQIPYLPTDEELGQAVITRQYGCVIGKQVFSALLKSWDYAPQSVGFEEDNFSSHNWTPVRGKWWAICEHSGIDIYGNSDDVTVENIMPRRYNPDGESHGMYGNWEAVTLRELPAALLSTLLEQAEALKAASINA